MLIEIHKKNLMGVALTFLTRYSEEGDEFLGAIVTGDGTWVFHHTPESKQSIGVAPYLFSHEQEMQNITLYQENTGKCLRDRKGILVDFMPNGITINAAAYCDTLRRLRRAI